MLTKIVPSNIINCKLKKERFSDIRKIIRMVSLGHHRNLKYVKEIIDLAYTMNGGGKRRIRTKQELYKLLKSSETIREKPVYIG